MASGCLYVLSDEPSMALSSTDWVKKKHKERHGGSSFKEIHWRKWQSENNGGWEEKARLRLRWRQGQVWQEGGEDSASSGCNVDLVRQLDCSWVQRSESKFQLNTSGQRCDSSHGTEQYKHTGCWTLPGDRTALYRLNTRYNSQGRHDAGHVTDVQDKNKKAGSMMQCQLSIAQSICGKSPRKRKATNLVFSVLIDSEPNERIITKKLSELLQRVAKKITEMCGEEGDGGDGGLQLNV